MAPRSEFQKLLNAKMAEHQLTNLLEGDGVRHKVTIGYRADREAVAIGHDIYCAELWRLRGESKSAEMDLPVSQYQAWYVDGVRREYSIDMLPETPMTYATHKFDLIFRDCIIPGVTSVRDPKSFVEYAMLQRGILVLGRDLKEKVLQIWANHYGVPYREPN